MCVDYVFLNLQFPHQFLASHSSCSAHIGTWFLVGTMKPLRCTILNMLFCMGLCHSCGAYKCISTSFSMPLNFLGANKWGRWNWVAPCFPITTHSHFICAMPLCEPLLMALEAPTPALPQEQFDKFFMWAPRMTRIDWTSLYNSLHYKLVRAPRKWWSAPHLPWSCVWIGYLVDSQSTWSKC